MERILSHEKLIVLVILGITVFFAFQIPDIKIDNDIKVFLPDDNPARVKNNRIEEIFGGNQRMIVAVRAGEGTIFTNEIISYIDKITGEFAVIQGIDEVTSVTNASYIAGTPEGMVVEELIQEKPVSNADINALKEKLLSWDFYRNNLYNDNFKSTQILLDIKDGLTTEEKENIYYGVKNVLDSNQKNNLETYVSGPSAVSVLMGNKMMQDITRLIPFIVIILLLALYLFFRRVLPVIVTTATVLISTIWSVGLMALLQINMTMVSTVIPVILIGVGSAYGIHILSHYYDHLAQEDDNLIRVEHRQIVIKTVQQLGKPVFLTGLTTVVGFGSLSTSKIVPVKTFGIFAAVGIATAFLVTILFIPSLLLICFNRDKGLRDGKYLDHQPFAGMIAKLHDFYSSRKVTIVVTTVIVVIISLIGMSKIIIDTPLIEMFKENTEIRQADEFLNSNFAGTSIMNIMVAGKEKGSLTDPEILHQMDNLERYLTGNMKEVGKVISITNFIKRMNRVMHYPEIEDSSQTGKQDNKQQPGSLDSETTSSFYSNQDSGQKPAQAAGEEETTSSFYGSSDSSQESTGKEENTSSFYSSPADGNEKNTGQSQVNSSNGTSGEPDINGNLSEYQFAELLNKALARADKLGLTVEELVDLINKETNFRGAAYNEIPYDLDKYPAEDKQGLKNLISQYLLLYSGNLDDMINDQLEPDKAQMIIQLNDPSNLVAARTKEKIINYTEEHFPGDYKVTVSGYADMALAANNLIVHSQTMSILVSFIIVFLIVAISFKSLVAGIYGIIPLGFSLLINFGLMGYAGIKLDIGTSMVASLAIGIGVDYTIHFLSGYHQERMKSDDLYQVTRNTLTTTGKAIIFNAISVAAGFLVLLASNFYPLVYLGLLIAVTMFTSSLAALTILPVLLNTFKPAFIARK